MLQERGYAPHDGEPQAQAAVGIAAARGAYLVELLEDARLQRRGDADAGVDHIDRDVGPARPGADQDAPALGVADGVGHEIAHHTLEQRRIAADGEPARHHAQVESLARGLRTQLLGDLGQQRRDGHARHARRQRAGLEPRKVEQLLELRLERGQAPLDAAHQRSPRDVGRARRERGDIQAERVQRLPQVVARRCEELALAAVGALGGVLRLVRGARFRLQLLDEVEVLVAHRERPCEDGIELVTEGQDEAQHHRHHEGYVAVDLVAFHSHAHDERQQRRQDEAIERRPIHRGEVEAAQHHAEEAHDEQRLVRLRGGEEHDGCESPQPAAERGTDGPVAAPSPLRMQAGTRASPCAREQAPPCLVQHDEPDPARHPDG